MFDRKQTICFLPSGDFNMPGLLVGKKNEKVIVANLQSMFQAGDFGGLKYPENYFDLILFPVVSHVPSYRALLWKEFYRVLKPEGRLCLVILSRRSGETDDDDGLRMKDLLWLEETLIYHGMENGFVFIQNSTRENRCQHTNSSGSFITLNLHDQRGKQSINPTTDKTYDSVIWLCKIEKEETLVYD